MASRALTWIDTARLMSTSGSRSVRYAVRAPGRRVSWTTWPSTHRTDIFSTYSEIFIESRRTGHGCSAEVSTARSGSGPRAGTAGVLMR